jgi:hypothetical protein
MAKLYERLAGLILAIENCKASGNAECLERHTENAESLVKRYLPSGSGFDCGTKLHIERSSGELLVFSTEFHHMDEQGGYDGWTSHTVRVRPSLFFGVRLTISGPNRNDIKELIHQEFESALDRTDWTE